MNYSLQIEQCLTNLKEPYSETATSFKKCCQYLNRSNMIKCGHSVLNRGCDASDCIMLLIHYPNLSN